MRYRLIKTIVVAICQCFWFILISAMPDWSYRMDNMLGWQGKTRRFDCFARQTSTTEIVKIPVEFRTCSVVNRAINTPATKKRHVRSVDNGVDFLKDYAFMKDFNS